jgi:HPt (histidine-containing phosphotransfer) domain-containing protein
VVEDDQQLREKARLLLQRERELFELRLKHEHIGVWLEIGQALPALFSGSANALPDVWNGIRRLMITKLRLQRVLLFEVQSESLETLAPAGPTLRLPAGARALLETEPVGACNDPDAAGALQLAALAEMLGLHRFVWSTIERAGGRPILLAAGFDRKKAVFQSPFDSGDVAHFKSVARQVESLLGNALLIAELEREKNQLRQTNATLEQRDAALRLAAEQLLAANESLEQRVQERTQELAGRNRDLRLVLDTVDQALLTMDLSGRLAPERSSATDSWFGAYEGSPSFVEYVGAERSFATMFELGLDALRVDLLPRELCLQQLPRRLERGARQFDCRYLPIDEDGKLIGLLLVIDDVTERLARAREETEQRELLAAFAALMRDRNGFLMFCDESERILDQLTRNGVDLVQQKRLLHTLKGNAATFGLLLVAELCHRAESELARGGTFSESLQRIRARWAEVRQTLRAVAADEQRSTIEISEQDIESLSTSALRGLSASHLLEEIRRLRWESSERHLGRLAQHAQALALRLGKGSLQVEIDADDARLEPKRWTPLWSEIVHVVRNAVDHGIESPNERDALGKARCGKLRLASRRVGSGYRIEVEDDGRGIDWQAIRDRCQQRGCPHATRADLVAAILSPEFSTRAQVSDTSGRGMGLAALANVVRELGGHVEVASESGHGSCWALTFPNLETPRASAT